MSQLLLALLIMTNNLACTHDRHQTAEATIQSKSVQVQKDGQPVQVSLQAVRVTMPLAESKSRQADILMIYEPQNQLFWWQYQALEPGQSGLEIEDFLSRAVIHMTGSKIVVFTFLTPFVWVRESSEHYPSLAEGQASVLATLKSKSNEIETGSLEWFRDINVGKALGPDFLRLKGGASMVPSAKLREVTKKDSQWHLILDGPNKDAAEVVLSEDYQLISAGRLPRKE